MKQVVRSVIEIFSQLSPVDEQSLVSIPYRLGLYISFSDVTGGWEAQELENQTLVTILKEFSQDFYKTEFIQKVLMDTISARMHWLHWARDIERVPSDLSALIKTLSPILEEEELAQFKEVMIDIAMSVAMAFQEQKKGGEEGDLKARAPMIRQLIFNLMGDKKSQRKLSHINISDSEKTALKTLADSMGFQGLS